MQEYEIRIFRADNTTEAILEMQHLNDHAAIRAAQKIAEARPFEVWRDLDCIYGRTRDPIPPSPNRRAA